jgi:DNA-binding transcriptional MerR regulator
MSLPELPEGQDQFKLNEVCKLANVQPYMLRFWGTEFAQLEATKSGTGQRLYSRDQVYLILEIRRLLFDEGLTIAGARKRIGDASAEEVAERIQEEMAQAPDEPSQPPVAEAANDERVEELLEALRSIRSELHAVVNTLRSDASAQPEA